MTVSKLVQFIRYSSLWLDQVIRSCLRETFKQAENQSPMHEVTPCACRASGIERSIGGLFTFGAPRCGDAESARVIADLYPGRAFRYAHGADLVPRFQYP